MSSRLERAQIHPLVYELTIASLLFFCYDIFMVVNRGLEGPHAGCTPDRVNRIVDEAI
jgi:hypothetical protein